MAVQLSWSIVHETIHRCLCLIRWQIHGCNNNEGNKSYLNDASYSISLAVVWVNEMKEVIWCNHVEAKIESHPAAVSLPNIFLYSSLSTINTHLLCLLLLIPSLVHAVWHNNISVTCMFADFFIDKLTGMWRKHQSYIKIKSENFRTTHLMCCQHLTHMCGLINIVHPYKFMKETT